MPNIRALIDLHVNSIYVPLNRVANVDDDTAAELIELGQATADPAHVEAALQHNPEIIELGGAKPKKKAKAKQENDPDQKSEDDTGDPETTETAKAKKAKSPPEEQAAGSAPE